MRMIPYSLKTGDIGKQNGRINPLRATHGAMMSVIDAHYFALMSAHTHSAEQYFIAANQAMASGERTQAEQLFLQALHADPACAEAMANLAYLKTQLRQYDLAGDYYRQALSLLPENVQIHLNYGALLMLQYRFDEAEKHYRLALQIAPASAAAWSNLGVLLASTQREAEAEECYRNALLCDPAYQKASFNLSYILLKQGRYEEGWQRLEARAQDAVLTEYFHFPRWQGEALSGKRILIAYEGGFGDMMQFCRYASLLKAAGASSVSLVCHPPLTRLMRSLHDIDEIYSYEDDVPHSGWDYWVLPMSLPFLCQTRLHTIPAHLPYLYADPTHSVSLPGLAPDARLRVGLVWQGNHLFDNDAARSIVTPDILHPLSAISDVQFTSLQKGATDEQLRALQVQLPIIDAAPLLHDFADTAALIQQLDLVISVDTAVAHLTAAMAKPCWVLLPYYQPDWRWLSKRTDSPWYPEVMRLFRQPAMHDWVSVIAEVVTALNSLQKQNPA